MRKLLVAALLLTVNAAPASAEVSFRPVDVYVDAGRVALGAYQVQITYNKARIKIAGLEGGETAAYRDAPYYDSDGLTRGRIVVASFVRKGVSDRNVPSGRTRVARLHVQVDSRCPEDALRGMTIRLIVAADMKGRRTRGNASLIWTNGAGRETER